MAEPLAPRKATNGELLDRLAATIALRRDADPATSYVATLFAKGRDAMIKKLDAGGYRLYSRKLDPKTGKRKNLGTFKTRAAAEKHEREVQYFKRH